MATGEVRRARQGTRTWLAALVIVSVLAFFLAPLFPKARPEAAPLFTEVDVREESASSAIDAFANNEETVQTSAFVQDEPLAGGRRVLTVSSAAQHYQAEGGDWLPIDARFSPAEGGFTNFTNALRLSTGETTALLNVRSGETRLQWQAQELLATTEQGDQVALAQVVDATSAQTGALVDGDRTVRYANSWTLAGVVEEITAEPGAVEQRLIFASRPALPGGAEVAVWEMLKLMAIVRLSPSTALFAEGVLQSGAFTTTGRVEIRDAGSNTVLVFEPVIAYEQDSPSVQSAGQYTFTPVGEGEWQVAVQTPWAWWADPARVYPVVLDPTMKMLGPITTAHICVKYSSNCPANSLVDPGTGSEAIYIGTNHLWGKVEALIRFDNLPTLPPGYMVEQADLLIAPKNHLSAYQARQIRVWQVTSAWDPTTVGYYPNSPTVAYPHLDQKSLVTGVKPAIPVKAEAFVTRFHLQTEPGGLVSGWLSGAIANNGLLLQQYPENNCSNCVDYATIFTDPLWTKTDTRNLDPGKPFPLSASEGSGIMLQITYAPPTLALNQPLFSSLPTFGEIYADAYHAYLPPSSSSTWTAIAVKGLEEVSANGEVLEQPVGNLRLARGCTDPFDSGCAVKTSQGAFAERPNFILTRGDPAGTDLEAWVYPPNPAAPANASLDTYLIDAIPSSNLDGNPTLTPGTRITQTLIMSTSEIMRLYNLNLQANTRVGVRVLATTNASGLGGEVEMPFIEARLFPPTAGGNTLVKDKDGQFIGGHTNFGAYEMGKIKVGPSQGGTWALGLEYFGSVDPTIGDPPITYTHPITMSLEVVVLACASNAIPSQQGCITVSKPTISTAYLDVGNFRVFSPAGFNCSGTYCETILPAGPGAAAPSIVWRPDWIGGQQDRWAAVAGAPILFDTASMYFWTNGNTWLAVDPGSGVEMLELFSGPTGGYPGVSNPGDPQYARLIPLSGNFYAAPPLALSDTADLHININVDRQVAEASTRITRQVKTSPAGLEDFTFRLGWEVQAEGYAATLANQTLTPINVPTDAEVASLTLLFGSAWDMDYSDVYMPNGRFTNLRNLPGSFSDGGVGAKVAAPASFGSNWQGVTALLLPVGENLPDSDAGCPGDCLDIRAANDTPSAPNRTWGLPDLNISGQAQTLFFNKPGELTVFSTDHPNALQAVSVPFSFRTFEGDVNVDVKVCPQSGSPEKVVVITGHSKIALPGLGSDTNPATMIGATFILCETSLREVSMQFEGPPDIPAGSTGILVNFVKGDVLIGPSNTQITFDLEYHDNSDVVDGAGTVTINTAGLFDLQTSGKVLAKVNYNGHAWVAWNPLDVGVDVKAWYGSWLQGNVHAHLWKGQGWQNKYHWLPNDNATHFAGSIAASINIKAGQAFSWAFIDIPPWDINFGITVAFGEFCKKSGCSEYEWGIKGKFTVIGYDVGFFYGFQSGFKFILGSDGHVLIDQYAATAAASHLLLPDAETLAQAGSVARAPNSAGKPLALTRIAVADPLAAAVTHPLAVTAFTGSFIAGLTWSQGAPALSLIRPDGVEITPANAAAYGVTVVSQPASTLFGVANPMPGTWQAAIDNTAANNDYHFVWFANKAIPDVDLLSPAGTVDLAANTTIYNVQWMVPTLPAGVDVRVSLYYSVTNSTVLTETQAAGGVIRENLPLSAGGYAWDLSSLAYGDYRVYARVYSGQPGNAPLEPTPTVTGTDQLPGEAWIIAPGVIRLLDAVAPAAPFNVAMIPIADGFWACWPHNAEKDLSGYVVRYFSPDVFGDYHPHDLRVHAEVAEPNTVQQCARLGGFNTGEQIMVQVAAYDASGNLSAFSDLNEAIAESGAPSESPDPGELVAVAIANQVTLTWGPVALPRGGGVWLYYSRGLPLGNGQREAPVDLGDLDEITLSLLDPGFVWFFAVQTHDDWGRLSRVSNVVSVLVSDGVDDDGDGMPDDWESAYDVDDPLQDEDGDGISNAEEARYRTHPHYADTDGDGFSDGTEIVGGSDPLDANSTPATYENYTSGLLPLPELNVEPRALIFRAYTGGPNPPTQYVDVSNLGGGVLAPVIADDAAWLTMTLDGETLSVQVDQTGLPAGHYRAVITVAGASGSFTQNSPQNVVVDLWVLAGAPPAHGKVYLPLILSLYSD